MKTKDVIEFLEIDIKCLNREIEYCNPNDDVDAQVMIANKKAIEKYKEIISLLQQGEKYKQMWEELYSKYGMCPIRKNDEEGYMSNILYKILEELEKKYFPKENKQ